MKKRFALTHPKKAPERVLEGIKNEVRKYIKREKNKPLPEDKDVWRVDCKFAQNDDELQEIRFSDIIQNIDEASVAKCESVMIEIVARSANVAPKKVEEIVEESSEEVQEETPEEIQEEVVLDEKLSETE